MGLGVPGAKSLWPASSRTVSGMFGQGVMPDGNTLGMGSHSSSAPSLGRW